LDQTVEIAQIRRIPFGVISVVGIVFCPSDGNGQICRIKKVREAARTCSVVTFLIDAS
jgi:hypothetical protein